MQQVAVDTRNAKGLQFYRRHRFAERGRRRGHPAHRAEIESLVLARPI